MFHVSERNGVSLSASRRFAVSDTACCSFLTMQRYKEYQRETIVSPDYFQLISSVKYNGIRQRQDTPFNARQRGTAAARH